MQQSTTHVPFIGRDHELLVVGKALASLDSGISFTLIFEGEPGIGKSRLLDEALKRASDHALAICRAAAAQLDRTRPFGPLIDALHISPSENDRSRARLAEMLYRDHEDHRSSFQMLNASQSPYRVSHAFIELIEELASHRPMILALEDVQWADPATLVTLRELVRRFDQLQLGLFVTTRPTPRSAELELVLGELAPRSQERLELGPLDDDAIVSLASAVIGANVGEGLHRQIRRAEGNPLYVIELVNALADDNALYIENDSADAATTGFPPTLRLTLLRQLTFLSSDTLDVLKIAAILGTTFEVSLLSRVLDRSPSSLLPATNEAIASRTVEQSGSRLAFRHDLIREAIYEDLPLSFRRALHQQVARTLAGAGASPLEVAEHFMLGAGERDPEAVKWLRDAAAEASPRSPTVAVDLLRRAIELMDPGDPERVEVLAELALSLLWSGRLDEGERVARSLLDRELPPHVYVRVELALTYLLIIQDRVDEFVPHIEALADRRELPPSERAQLRAEVGFGRLLAADLDKAEIAARLAVDEGEMSGNDAAVSLGLATLSWRSYSRGFLEEAVSLGEEAVRRAENTSMPDARRQHPHLFLGMVYMGCDRFDEAEAMFAKGHRLGEEIGTVWNLPMYHLGRALRRFYAGEWDDALSEVESGIAYADEFGTRTGIAFLFALAVQISVRRDDMVAAERQLESMQRMITPEGARFGTDHLMWARALFLEATGHEQDALSVLEAAWDLHSAFKVNTQYRMGPHLVRSALVVDRVDRARNVAAAVDEVAGVSRTHSARATALRCRGLVLNDPDLMIEAVAEYGRGPRVVEAAAGAEDAATILVRHGRKSEAARLIGNAIDVYERIGATRDLKRALAVERTTGIKRGRRGARPRADVGWDSLTATERAVVDLAADGLTNRQIGERLFISPRTVQTHLSHVFGKLGIASRRHLITEAARHPTVTR